MSFFEKLRFWKHDDPFESRDVLSTGIGGEPLPPLDDPSANNFGSENSVDPLAHTDPYTEEPLSTNSDPLTPNPYGENSKYSLPDDPTMPNNNLSAQSNDFLGETKNNNMEVNDFANMSEEDRLRSQIERKYSPENLAKQESIQKNNFSQQNGSPTANSRDLEIINLKLDAVKSEVSSITHQLDKLERLLMEKRNSW